MSQDSVVVIGGGTMGAGIAQCLIEAGAEVMLVEGADDRVEAAYKRVEDGLKRRYKREGNPQVYVAEAIGRLTLVAGLPDGGAGPAPGLVVEAVYEDADLKREVLANCEKAFPGALLASNTSSLSIDGLAAGLADPARFVGMHFFNPVPLSQLVEIVVGSATTPGVVEGAEAWVERLKKTSIVVKDSPGFATSRLGLVIGLEAIRMVEEGVASVQDIDRGMVLGYKYPIGPLELGDLVGLDVRLAIAEHLHRELGERFNPPQLLRDMVARGEVGKKSGKGFYDWSSGEARGK
jgi:3-hydroxybutyryl-CoA dehydrogenase